MDHRSPLLPSDRSSLPCFGTAPVRSRHISWPLRERLSPRSNNRSESFRIAAPLVVCGGTALYDPLLNPQRPYLNPGWSYYTKVDQRSHSLPPTPLLISGSPFRFSISFFLPASFGSFSSSPLFARYHHCIVLVIVQKDEDQCSATSKSRSLDDEYRPRRAER